MKPSNDSRCSETTLTLPWRGHVRAARRHVWAMSWREAVAAVGAFEWVALSYLGVSGALIILFHKNLPGAMKHLAAHAGIAAFIVVLSWVARRWPSRGVVFVRHWYPQAFFLFCFEELHYLVHLIFSRLVRPLADHLRLLAGGVCTRRYGSSSLPGRR